MTQLIENVAESLPQASNTAAVRRFTDAELVAIYAQAYGHYQRRNYRKAIGQFGCLAVYRPTNVKFLKGLAASQFMACDYEGAITTYSFLLALHPRDIEAQCMCGHALLMTGERVQARKALIRALLLQTGAPEFKARARALLELIGD